MPTTVTTVLRPPLKWAGGKRWQVPHLEPLWKPHTHRRLVEPFCGGLAVTLGLLPARALLNDANPHLINFYAWLQKGVRLDLQMENDEALFYQHRDRFNALLATGKSGSRQAAALFYYLNRTGYNGLCRFNRSGEFNVPFGRYARIGYTRDFTPYREVFAAWTFTTTRFEDVPLERTDFVYADPPYDVEFTDYARADSPGTISSGPRNGWQHIADPWCSSIKRPNASRRCIGGSAIRSRFSMHHAGSVAPAIAPRPARSWAGETCDSAQHQHRCRARGDDPARVGARTIHA